MGRWRRSSADFRVGGRAESVPRLSAAPLSAPVPHINTPQDAAPLRATRTHESPHALAPAEKACRAAKREAPRIHSKARGAARAAVRAPHTHAAAAAARCAAFLPRSRAGNKSSSCRRRAVFRPCANQFAPSTPSTLHHSRAQVAMSTPPSPRTPTARRARADRRAKKAKTSVEGKARRRRSSRRPPRQAQGVGRGRRRREAGRAGRAAKEVPVRVFTTGGSTPSSFSLSLRSTGSHAQAAAEPAKPAEEPKAAEPTAEPAERRSPPRRQ